MSGANKERWIEVCELARSEQDPTKFMALIDEINRLLEQRERRPKTTQISDSRPVRHLEPVRLPLRSAR